MTDKQSSRQQTSLAMMPESGKLLLFSDQQQDNFKKSQATITASSFIRLGKNLGVRSQHSTLKANLAMKVRENLLLVSEEGILVLDGRVQKTDSRDTR